MSLSLLMHAKSVPRMVQLVVLAPSKASDSLMSAESVPSMVQLVVLPSPKASPSLMRAESVPSLLAAGPFFFLKNSPFLI